MNANGYYHNLSYLFENGDKSKRRLGMLRGEFKVDNQNSSLLRVQFTEYPGTNNLNQTNPIWKFAELAEDGRLTQKIFIVPTWVVRLFFGKGVLREIYTDETLRIVYGSDGKDFSKESLYIMERAQNSLQP